MTIKKNQKYILNLMGIIIIFILIFFLIISIFLKGEKNKNVQNIGENENYLIVSPNRTENNIETELNEKLKKNTLSKLKTVENTFQNWVDLFDIFSFNRNQQVYLFRDSTGNNNDIVNKISKIYRLPNIYDDDYIIKEYGDLIKKECNLYKLDWRLVLAIINQESAFNPNAISRAGAFGLMQIMPRTGSNLQAQLNLEDYRTPQNNLIAGIYYFATLNAAFEFIGEDKYKFALASYNAGLGRVIDAMTITNYFAKDYKTWDNVKVSLPYLSSYHDSIHLLVWPSNKRPVYGILNNWKEPYLYVENIVYLFSEYKKIIEPNLVDDKIIKRKKIKNSEKKLKTKSK